MRDLISRKALLAEYDRVHIGEPGKARKLIEDAPAVDAVEVVCLAVASFLCGWIWERARYNYEISKKTGKHIRRIKTMEPEV